MPSWVSMGKVLNRSHSSVASRWSRINAPVTVITDEAGGNDDLGMVSVRDGRKHMMRQGKRKESTENMAG